MLFITKMCIYASMMFQGETFSEPCSTLPPPCMNEYNLHWELVESPEGSDNFIEGHDYVFTEVGIYVFDYIATVYNEGNNWSGVMATDTVVIDLPPDLYLDSYVICRGEAFYPIEDTVPFENTVWDTMPDKDTYYKVVTTNEYCSKHEEFEVKVVKCESNSSFFEFDNDNKGVYLPNVFSPNGDSINDVYEVYMPSDAILKNFSVYDRWGGLVTTEHPWFAYDDQQGTYTVSVCVEVEGKEMNLIQSVILMK